MRCSRRTHTQHSLTDHPLTAIGTKRNLFESTQGDSSQGDSVRRPPGRLATRVALRDTVGVLTPVRIGTASRGKQWFALAVAALASVWVVGFAAKHSPATAVGVLLGTGGCALFTVWHRAARRSGHGSLGVRAVVCVIGLVFLVAVVLPNRTSNDLWSYGTYGRMVAVHHVDPYTAEPAQFPRDPFAGRVSTIWQHRSSVYGPVWVAVATLDALIVGSSALLNRLYFQVLAMLAAGALLILVWRRTQEPAALVWLGLHPVFVVAVNSGHADLLIGLAILAGALLATRGRGWITGVVIGLAALVKITALLGLVGLVLWAWRTRRRRLLPGLVLGSGLVLVVVYAPFVADAGHVLTNSDHTVSTWSPWNGVADLILGQDAWRTVPNPLAYNATLEVIFTLGVVLVAVLALVVGWHTSEGDDPRPAAGATSAAFAIGAAYSLPWYSLWGLPAFADSDPTPLAWVVWLQAAAMLTVLKFHDHPAGTVADAIPRFFLTVAFPLVWVVAFVLAGLRTRTTPTPARA